MNWEAIGAIAELAGAVGVILSLIYLASQIQLNSKQVEQNSRFIESSVYQSVNDATIAWLETIARDPQLAGIWRKIRAGVELEESERPQAWGLASMLFVTMDGQRQHFENGVISRAPLDQAQLDQLIKSPYMSEWIERNADSILTPGFSTELKRLKET